MEITGERVFSVGDEGTTKINGGRKIKKCNVCIMKFLKNEEANYIFLKICLCVLNWVDL